MSDPKSPALPSRERMVEWMRRGFSWINLTGADEVVRAYAAGKLHTDEELEEAKQQATARVLERSGWGASDCAMLRARWPKDARGIELRWIDGLVQVGETEYISRPPADPPQSLAPGEIIGPGDSHQPDLRGHEETTPNIEWLLGEIECDCGTHGRSYVPKLRKAIAVALRANLVTTSLEMPKPPADSPQSPPDHNPLAVLRPTPAEPPPDFEAMHRDVSKPDWITGGSAPDYGQPLHSLIVEMERLHRRVKTLEAYQEVDAPALKARLDRMSARIEKLDAELERAGGAG